MKTTSHILTSAILATAVAGFLHCASCKTPEKTGTDANKDTTKETTAENDEDAVSASGQLNEKYLREGFISGDLFRVVIVTAANDPSESMEQIEEKARQRAFVSMQRFIQSEDRPVNQNTKAEILNVINANGVFKKKDFRGYKDQIYYLEVQQENLKRHLSSMAERR